MTRVLLGGHRYFSNHTCLIVAGDETGEIEVTSTIEGPNDLAGLADHYQAGMVGKITVAAK